MDNNIENVIREKFTNAKNRLVLLDYDGTLVNYVSIPQMANLPPHIFDILYNLNDMPEAKIFIITGRAHEDIDKMLNNMPIDIIAEHGAMIKEKGLWRYQLIDNFPWKEPIISIIERFSRKCPGSYIEEKTFSVSWHYRNADTDLGLKYSRELITLLKSVSMSYNIRILDGKKIVEVLTNDSGKGSAVKRLIEQEKYDFILCIGDDATDEEMFEFLLDYTYAITIKVGEGSTYAKYKLDNVNEVVVLLNHLLT
jgi:trehalose 6-phosphate synthase/phosphatase